jgi:hypothetical protein
MYQCIHYCIKSYFESDCMNHSLHSKFATETHQRKPVCFAIHIPEMALKRGGLPEGCKRVGHGVPR